MLHRVIFVFFLLFSTGGGATSESFDEWKKTFEKQAIEQGVDKNYLKTLLPKMHLLPTVVKSDRKQPEFHSTFWDYLEKRVTDKRIEIGKQKYEQYQSVLTDTALKYGVPPQYILAFWGLETNYGGYMGNVDILSALATLAYDKRRRTFFTKQLIAFIQISYENQLTDIRGSWAGAFGNFQFIPTTFKTYAIDGDNDGQIDLINSVPDAIHSAAHYLSEIGWKPKQRWGREVFPNSSIDWSKIRPETPLSLEQWNELGIIPADGSSWNPNDFNMMAELIMPMGADGPLFLVYPNFRHIMKWNKSILYALCVGILADRISGSVNIIYAPRMNNHFSYEQAKQLQQKLSEMGYYNGKIDGDLGRQTRGAIVQYQLDNNLAPDGYATENLLKLINKIK